MVHLLSSATILTNLLHRYCTEPWHLNDNDMSGHHLCFLFSNEVINKIENASTLYTLYICWSWSLFLFFVEMFYLIQIYNASCYIRQGSNLVYVDRDATIEFNLTIGAILLIYSQKCIGDRIRTHVEQCVFEPYLYPYQCAMAMLNRGNATLSLRKLLYNEPLRQWRD